MEGGPVIEFRNARKVYAQGRRDVVALDGLSLQIGRREFVTIMGPSGSGKSTLLHLAGGLDVPTSGDVLIGIRQGSRLHVDARSLSGDTSSDVELGSVEVSNDGPLVWVKAATMSGDIRIVRA